MKILIDTTILVDLLPNRNQRRKLLLHLLEENHLPVTTVLNVAELFAGMRPSEATVTEALLSGLVRLALTERAA